MTSDMNIDDAAVFPNHSRFILITVGFPPHDVLPLGQGYGLIIRMH